MKDKIISKRDLAGLVDKLLGEYEIFAPVKKGSLVLFDRVHSGTDAFFEYANTLKSPKEIFLPQSEVLFTYSHEQVDGAANIEAPPGEDRPRLAIETAEAWCRGEVTIEEVRAAADAAYAAHAAGYAAAYAADTAAYHTAAHVSTLACCADLVREVWPEPPAEVLAMMEGR